MPEKVAREAHELTTAVAEFRREVQEQNQQQRRHNHLIVILLVVGALLFASVGYIAWTGRAASKRNGRTLHLIEGALNPDSKIRKDGLCTQLILHDLDGPACARVRRELVDAGARLP